MFPEGKIIEIFSMCDNFRNDESRITAAFSSEHDSVQRFLKMFIIAARSRGYSVVEYRPPPIIIDSD